MFWSLRWASSGSRRPGRPPSAPRSHDGRHRLSHSQTGLKTGSANPAPGASNESPATSSLATASDPNPEITNPRAMRDRHRGNTGHLPTALEQMGAFRCDELSPVAGPA